MAWYFISPVKIPKNSTACSLGKQWWIGIKIPLMWAFWHLVHVHFFVTWKFLLWKVLDASSYQLSTFTEGKPCNPARCTTTWTFHPSYDMTCITCIWCNVCSDWLILQCRALFSYIAHRPITGLQKPSESHILNYPLTSNIQYLWENRKPQPCHIDLASSRSIWQCVGLRFFWKDLTLS